MKDYPSTKGNTMFYRLLGKLFFLFWICPTIARTARFVLRYAATQATKKLAEENRKNADQRRQSRRDHPAGSRRPE